MAKAFSGPVEINGKKYEVRGVVAKQRVTEWPEGYPVNNQQTRASRRFLQSWHIPYIKGLLATNDFDGSELLCYDSTVETRFPGQITLPPLWYAEAAVTTNVASTSTWRLAEQWDNRYVAVPTRASAGSGDYTLKCYKHSTTGFGNAVSISAANAKEWHLHDFIAHDTYLFAVYHLDSDTNRELRRASADGGAFTNPCSPDPGNFPDTQADEDRTLLASVGGRLYCITWTASSGLLTVYYTVDNGVTWAAATATTSAYSFYAPKKAIAWANAIGDLCLTIATSDGLIQYDTDGDNPRPLIRDVSISAENGRGMCVWHNVDRLYYPVYTTSGRLIELSWNDGVLVQREVGLDQGSGLNPSRRGQIVSCTPAGQWLFALNEQSTGDCGVFAFDGENWHHIYDANTSSGSYPVSSSAKPLFICQYNSGGACNALLVWYYNGALDSAHSFSVLENPLVLPTVAYREVTGTLDLAWFAGGLPEIDGCWLQFLVDCDGLDADTTGEHIDVSYAIDGGTLGGTDLGDLLSGDKDLQFGSGAGISAKKIALRLKFDRAAAATTSTPKLYSATLEYLKIPSVRNYYRFTVDVKKTAQLHGRTPKSIRTDLEAVEASVTQVTFSLPGDLVGKYVKAMEPTPAIQSEFSGVPNPVEGQLVADEAIEMVMLELL